MVSSLAVITWGSICAELIVVDTGDFAGIGDLPNVGYISLVRSALVYTRPTFC